MSIYTLKQRDLAMTLELSTIIDRPPAVVFDFYAVNQVRNHPRWDPHMHLEQLTEGAVRVGTRIKRRHTRAGSPIEGVMEVVEFEPDRAMGMDIIDQTPNGPLEVHGRATFEAVGEGSTKLTFYLDIPGMPASMDPSMIEGSLRRIKELVEAEN